MQIVPCLGKYFALLRAVAQSKGPLPWCFSELVMLIEIGDARHRKGLQMEDELICNTARRQSVVTVEGTRPGKAFFAFFPFSPSSSLSTCLLGCKESGPVGALSAVGSFNSMVSHFAQGAEDTAEDDNNDYDKIN